MNGPLKLLLVEDSPDDAELITEELRAGGLECDPKRVDTLQDLKQALEDGDWDLVIADYTIRNLMAPRVLEEIESRSLDLPIIVVSGAIGEQVAVDMMRSGVSDFVMKGSISRFVKEGESRLTASVKRELEQSLQRRARREVENQIAIKIRDLARANENLENFVYAAFHDMKEPLRQVVCYSELLEDEHRSELSPEANDIVARIVEGVGRMSRIIDGLATYAGIREQEDVTVDMDCKTVLDEATRNIEKALSESSAEIRSDLLPRMTGRPAQLVQLFQNLLANAIKYRHPDRPPIIDISVVKKTSEWLFSIRDNGVGFDPKNQEKIFGLFQRLHGSDIEGSGIGLAICQKIVDLHGGQIWAESTPGEGSLFQFTLPVMGVVSCQNAVEQK